MRFNVILILLLFVFTACDNTPPAPTSPFTSKTSLLEYGIPVTLSTPEGAKVTNNSDNLLQDVTIEGQDYYVQIYGSGATTTDCAKLAQEALTEYKTTDAAFKRVVEQDNCGFMYELEVDNDTTKSYNFVYFTIKGNKAYNFTTTAGPLADFDQADVKAIYDAVKAQK
jgi:hypothetical protein